MSEVRGIRCETYQLIANKRIRHCHECYADRKENKQDYVRQVSYHFNTRINNIFICHKCKKRTSLRRKTFTDVTELLPLLGLSRLPGIHESIRITITENADLPSLIDLEANKADPIISEGIELPMIVDQETYFDTLLDDFGKLSEEYKIDTKPILVKELEESTPQKRVRTKVAKNP